MEVKCEVFQSGNREKISKKLRCLIKVSLQDGSKSGIFKVKWKAGKRKI